MNPDKEEIRKQRRSEYLKRYRQENKEKIRTRIDDWRNRNRDKVNEDSKLYKEKKGEIAKEWSRKYYERNTKKVKSQNKIDFQNNKEYYYQKRKEYMAALVQWVENMKKEIGCRNCGTKEKLEYHHIKPSDKFMEISTMVNAMMNKEKILKEIEKCEILCKQCHVEIHNIIGRKRKSD